MVEVYTDPEYGTVVADDDLSTSDIRSALGAIQENYPEMASMMRWAGNTQRKAGIFERDRFVTPVDIFEQMKTAQDAAEADDIVAGVLESTEALAFSRARIEVEDEDEEDIWNQIYDDLDLDARFREMWRELFVVSQCYLAVWPGTKTYKVRGRNRKSGRRRKQQFQNLKVPQAISILDPLKVIPVGSFLFGQEQLVWVANQAEAEEINSHLQGTALSDDDVIEKLVIGRYEPKTKFEQEYLGKVGVGRGNSLFLLDPRYVWRHTLTRPAYKPMAEVRLKSVFAWLDLKHLLMEMDRAHVLGATNFIVLITKGTDTMPAKQAEITQLQSQVRTLARVPVIVGDHRLEIKIITPDTDNTLDTGRYSTIDSRIAGRLYQMFTTGTAAAGTRSDDSIKLARVVARGLESRRFMLKKSIEDRILKPIYEDNEEFTEPANLVFTPTQVSLNFDPNQLMFMLDMADRQRISSQTLLDQIDLDLDDEIKKLEREQQNIPEKIRPVLQSRNPFADGNDGGGGQDRRTTGRNAGGNRNGGGRGREGDGHGQETDPRRRTPEDEESE